MLRSQLLRIGVLAAWAGLLASCSSKTSTASCQACQADRDCLVGGEGCHGGVCVPASFDANRCPRPTNAATGTGTSTASTTAGSTASSSASATGSSGSNATASSASTASSGSVGTSSGSTTAGSTTTGTSTASTGSSGSTGVVGPPQLGLRAGAQHMSSTNTAANVRLGPAGAPVESSQNYRFRGGVLTSPP
ncbi:MAG: hypothetical protein JST54_21480 [Deltaproteobacteria bacterium]|nr:hypothetical protein [Deltaproteobacteria bacterium]